MRIRSSVGALILIAVGGLLLASNLGYLPPRIGPLFHQWWPAILIVVGAVLTILGATGRAIGGRKTWY